MLSAHPSLPRQLAGAARLSELTDQVEVVRSTLSKAAGDRARKNGENAELQRQVEERKARQARAEQKLKDAEVQLERSRSHMGNLEQAAKQMEEVHAQEEARMRAAEKEAALIKEKMFHESQKLFDARKTEANLTAEISGAQRVSRNSTHRILQLDENAQRQKELVYAADFQLQLMERKVHTQRDSNPQSPDPGRPACCPGD